MQKYAPLPRLRASTAESHPNGALLNHSFRDKFERMRNVTISLDDDTAAWARKFAAERDTSVSGLVADLIAEKRRTDDVYEAAKRQFFARPLRPLSRAGDRYPTREELYDRPVLRRR